MNVRTAGAGKLFRVVGDPDAILAWFEAGIFSGTIVGQTGRRRTKAGHGPGRRGLRVGK